MDFYVENKKKEEKEGGKIVKINEAETRDETPPVFQI